MESIKMNHLWCGIRCFDWSINVNTTVDIYDPSKPRFQPKTCQNMPFNDINLYE